MKEILIKAISERQVLTLRYHGYSRTVEPHCFGIDPNGQLKLRCWQSGGGSVSGEMPAWKMLFVREIHGIEPSAQTFPGARPDYKKDDSAMRRIYAQL